MKISQILKPLCFLLLIPVAVNAQMVDNSKRVTFDEILSKLTFTSRVSTSNEKINNDLSKIIKVRKVKFKLDETKEKNLKKAKATDDLIQKIRQNQPEILSFETIKHIFNNSANDKTSLDNVNEYLTWQACEFIIDYKLTNKQKKTLGEIGANEVLLKEVDNSYKIVELYNTFVSHYDSDQIDRKKIALEAAKEFINIYKTTTCPNRRDLLNYANYFNNQISFLEDYIKSLSNPDNDRPHPFPKSPRSLRYEKFHSAYVHSATKNKDWKKVFEAGDEILKHEPEHLDAAILMASIGYNRIVKPDINKKYDKKTIAYAELAIELIAKGVKSKDEYGTYNYRYKTKDNTLGWMNFIIGFIKYYRLNQKEEGIEFLIKASKYNSEVKDFKEIQDILSNSQRN